jgi:hypothetical protein
MANEPETVEDYLAGLAPERSAAIQSIREVLTANLADGFEEGLQYGMLGYYVPHSAYPQGYHANPKEPLPFASMGSQKKHIGLYLFCVYTDETIKEWFVDAWKASGCRLCMGKSCVRVKSFDAVLVDVLAELFQRISLKSFLNSYESALGGRRSK